ncbi:MAG TPA: hypothetical protein VE778_06180 [Candidatus Bathyarchaeia archaeon]|jgi:hypothetical protein|nr:hypothetical protein [Candidatus Bathyarchaeia archaeon]
MSYSEQIRHPSAALDLPQEKKQNGVPWLWIIAGIVTFILVLYFLPQGLAKIDGIVGGSEAAGKARGVSNSNGWV